VARHEVVCIVTLPYATKEAIDLEMVEVIDLGWRRKAENVKGEGRAAGQAAAGTAVDAAGANKTRKIAQATDDPVGAVLEARAPSAVLRYRVGTSFGPLV
jgi:hypothetical protein